MLLKPVQTENHNGRVDGDGIGGHGEYEDAHLRKCVERVEIDGVEAGLRIRAAGEEESIDVRELAAGCREDEDGTEYGQANNPKVYEAC